ncbi:amino acid ABC transporter permease [Actinoallomurus sp. NPDC052274]|uniref:amino acid ABC transporter permease n=1 Tax=Actinoallomurus sp. NPDC052274 TaxID=3155420 RepID=UPI00342C3493
MSLTEQARAVDAPAPGDEIHARRRRQPASWVGAAIVAVLAAMLVHTLIRNPRYQWSVVGDYFTSTQILSGLLQTLELTVLSMLIGIVLGTVLAIMRQSRNPILSGTAWGYVWFFRGTPLLVQVIFWYNLASLYPRLSVGIPFGPAFVTADANHLVSRLTAALLGLGLNQAAYTAEIVRAGILSVPRGQIEAATALGMTPMTRMRRIVLPQAMRVIIPPIGNETIGMLKTTSLVSVLAMPELLYSAQLIYSRTYQTMPLLIVASLWYLIVTTVLTLIQTRIEKYFGRGTGRRSSPGAVRRFGKRAFTFHGAPRVTEGGPTR